MTDSLTAATVLKRDVNVVKREIAGETVLVPVTGRLANLQRIYSLSRTGGFLWDRMDGSRSLSELSALLADVFEVTPDRAERDVLAFAREMRDEGLADSVS